MPATLLAASMDLHDLPIHSWNRRAESRQRVFNRALLDLPREFCVSIDWNGRDDDRFLNARPRTDRRWRSDPDRTYPDSTGKWPRIRLANSIVSHHNSGRIDNLSSYQKEDGKLGNDSQINASANQINSRQLPPTCASPTCSRIENANAADIE
jgi:hypothetical protein